MLLYDKILASRGLSAESRAFFLLPDYSKTYNPFLLPDMEKAVNRLITARKKQECIVIYGDYDIDGLTSAALLFDAFNSFGFKNVEIFIPNRFSEGYGLTIDMIEKIAGDGAQLVVTVDCGSSSEKEIIRANELNLDVIVTDHHSVSTNKLPALAVVNPKLDKCKYPFTDLAGVGVAFKLVQAMQTKLDGLPNGQEKWLLDLVAMGTVCDVVPLIDENRTNVYFGLKVLAQTKRPGLKALMAVSSVDAKSLDTRSIGFRLGPRMNAAGRLETAQHALDMLISDDPILALEKVEYLNELNKSRRFEQDKIYKQAIIQAEAHALDPVIVVSDAGWNHGIVGIVAAKLLEKYKKPTFVIQELGNESKGSARSFGDFSVIDAINASEDIIKKGGGHKFAAGVTLPTKNIKKFRKRVNEFYKSLNLMNQETYLLPSVDATAELDEINEELVDLIVGLEPFGIGNPQPVIEINGLSVKNVCKMGDESQHIKLELQDSKGKKMQFVAFNASSNFFVEVGETVSVWFQPSINEWKGNRSVEGQLLHLEVVV